MSLRRIGILLGLILWPALGFAQSNIPGRVILGPSNAMIGHVICDSGCSAGSTTRTASGNVTNNGDELIIDTTGMATVTVYNTFQGTNGSGAAQASNDGGVNWSDVLTVNRVNGYQSAFSIIPNASIGSFIYPVAGYDRFKIVLVGKTSGTHDTYALQAVGVPWTFPRTPVTVVGVNGVGAITSGGGELVITGNVSQNGAGSNAAAWWTRIGDTSNGPVAVKAASTAAVLADPALVVAVSPNNTPVLPTGASTESTLALIKAKTDNLDVALSTRTKPADAQHAILDSGTTVVTQPTGTNLHVVCDGGTCGGAASFADNSAFTAGTTGITNIGAVFNDGLAAVTAGNSAAPRITNTRGMHVNLRTAAGVEIPLPAALGANGGLKIEGVASGVAVPTKFSAVTTQAVSLNAVSTATITLNGANSLIFDYRTGLVGTTFFEMTVDGVNWFSPSILDVTTNAPPRWSDFGIIGSGAAPATYVVNVTGATQARINVTAYTSGTLTGTLSAGIGAFPLRNPQDFTLSVRVWDGTNTATVKPASTSALSADPALVVRTVQLPTALAANGGLKTTATYDSQTQQTGTWTSASTPTVVISTAGMATVIVSARKTGVVSTGVGTIEVSDDGVNFTSIPLSKVRVVAGNYSPPSGSNGVVLATATVHVLEVDCAGYTNVQFRNTIGLTGAGSFAIRLSAVGAAASPIGVQATTQGTAASIAGAWPITVTDTFNAAVIKGIAAPASTVDNALVVSLSPNSPTPGTDDTTTNGAITATTCTAGTATQAGCVILPLAGHQSIAVTWPAGGTGIMTLVAEFATDTTGTTWVGSYFDVPNGSKSTSQTTVNANTAFTATIVPMGGARYVRVRATAFTSGTTTVTVSATAVNDPTVLFTGPDGGTTTPPMLAATAGAVTTTAPTYVTGQQKQPSLDLGGRTRVKNAQDEGRSAKSFYANNVASGTTTTETLITLTQSSGTGATSSAASYTITNGKTFRITGIQVASRGNATATIQSTVFNLRMNTGGACIVTSTPILFAAQSATPATASTWDRVIIPIPDGYEIAGNGTISICISAAATFVTNAPTWAVNLIGFEY